MVRNNQIKKRLIAAAFAALLVIVPGATVGVIVGKLMEEAVVRGVEARLIDQAMGWRIVADSYEKDLQNQEDNAGRQARDIITAQTKMAYELVDKALTDNSGSLSRAAEEDLLSRLSRHSVGRTGYVWILDYQGKYILSQGRARDGENIWDTTYDSQTFPIREVVSIGRGLKSSEVGFYKYLWANTSDPEPRSKIAAIMHFPGIKWVMGVSAYYDDVVSMDFRARTIEDLKDLIAAQEVGRSGYIAVVNRQGRYVVSLNRARDGEDISQAKDASGRPFIREGIDLALAAGDSAEVVRYPWRNPGEDTDREKIGAVAYYEPWDWVIWPNAYLDDFAYTSELIRWIILAIVVGALVAGFIGYELTYRYQKSR